MFWVLSFCISASCSTRMLLDWSQAKSTLVGPALPRVSIAAGSSTAAGKADTDMAAEMKRMEANCILSDYGGS